MIGPTLACTEFVSQSSHRTMEDGLNFEIVGSWVGTQIITVHFLQSQQVLWRRGYSQGVLFSFTRRRCSEGWQAIKAIFASSAMAFVVMPRDLFPLTAQACFSSFLLIHCTQYVTVSPISIVIHSLLFLFGAPCACV